MALSGERKALSRHGPRTPQAAFGDFGGQARRQSHVGSGTAGSNPSTFQQGGFRWRSKVTALDVVVPERQVRCAKQVTSAPRMKLVITSLSDRGVHEDVATKRGPTQSYKIDGNVELVIGGPSGEVTIQATLD